MKKKAIITGICGQDGYYLAKLLNYKNYEVYGITRKKEINDYNLKKYVNKFYVLDLADEGQINEVLTLVKPDEVYHLAAFHFSSQNHENYEKDFKSFLQINLITVQEILEWIRYNSPMVKFFYASSCQIYGKNADSPQNEKTPYRPDSLYSISKVAATDLCSFYRNRYNIYVSVGILYNHESVRRSDDFITTIIAKAAAKAYLNLPVKLEINNLNAIVDWGAAEDFVQAMWLTLRPEKSDHYLISTGISHTVLDFVKCAFNFVNRSHELYVTQKVPIDLNSNQTKALIGDNSKIRKVCKWNPETSFEKLVHEMVSYQIDIFKNRINDTN